MNGAATLAAWRDADEAPLGHAVRLGPTASRARPILVSIEQGVLLAYPDDVGGLALAYLPARGTATSPDDLRRLGSAPGLGAIADLAVAALARGAGAAPRVELLVAHRDQRACGRAEDLRLVHVGLALDDGGHPAEIAEVGAPLVAARATDDPSSTGRLARPFDVAAAGPVRRAAGVTTEGWLLTFVDLDDTAGALSRTVLARRFALGAAGLEPVDAAAWHLAGDDEHVGVALRRTEAGLGVVLRRARCRRCASRTCARSGPAAVRMWPGNERPFALAPHFARRLSQGRAL